MSHKRIVIVDDHPLLAAALHSELGRAGADVELLDATVGATELLNTVFANQPDCAVIDLGLPFPGGGSSLIAPIAQHDIRVVVLTGETERQLLARAADAGAEAVLSKSEPLTDIVETILMVAGGHAVRSAQRAELAAELRRLQAEQSQREAPFAGLSPRERQVLAGLMHGQGPALLAERNYVSVTTVRSQIRSVLSKLGVSSQLQAVAMAHQSGWNPEADGS